MSRTALFIGLLVLVAAVDYCQVNQPLTKLFLQKDQARILNLNTYLTGYDLAFDTDTPQLAKIYSSYQQADTQAINLRDYSSLKSVDVRSFGSLVGLGKLGLFAQKDNNKQVGIWVGDFTGYQYLPSFNKFKSFTLPLPANCFDFRIASDMGDGILNCQAITADDKPHQDLFCYISPNDTELTLGGNCNLVQSFQTGIQRKSTVFKLNGKTYLLSRNKQSLQSIDYITLYYYNSNKQFVFLNIIDGSSFDDPALSITDYIVDKNNQIVVADSRNPRLIAYSYSPDNQVKVKAVLTLNTKPTALSYSSKSHTVFVASRTQITEYSVSNWAILNVYEVDQSDSLITSVMASEKLLVFTTRNNNLFIYQRQQKKINYLLDRVKLANGTTLLLSNEDRYVFTFNFTHAQSVSIAKPYVELSGFTSSKTIKITGTSTTRQCQVTLDITYIQDSSNIFNKKNIQDTSFKVDPLQGLTLNLRQFYGGSNLKYNLPNKAEQGNDFISSIKQIESFNFKPTFGQAQVSTVLAIDSNSFYMVGINSIKQNMAYVDICNKTQNSRINCTNYYSQRVPFQISKFPVDKITVQTATNGVNYAIWTYKISTLICILNLNLKQLSMEVTGDLKGLGYSSVAIASDYFVLVSKTGRRFQVYFNKQVQKNCRIDETSFTQQQLKQLQYFYPRQAILDPNNDRSFFLKLPTKIARFIILDDFTIKFVQIVRDFGTYQPDKQWSVRPTKGKSILVVRDNEFRQQYYNPSQQKFITLQQVQVDNVVASTLTYNPQTNFATVSTSGEKNFLGSQVTKVIIPQAGAMDSQYCQVLSSEAVKVSQNWFLTASSTPQISFINSDPILSVYSNLPDDVFKEDVSLTIEIKSGSKSETTKAMVQGFNFPVAIKDVPSGSTIKMPYNTTGSSVTVEVGSFFNGPITDYSLNCPYCKDNITLTPAISLHKKMVELSGVVDYESVKDRIVALSNNLLFILNQQSEIISRAAIMGDHFCRNMHYNADVGLLLFCTSPTVQSGQIILQYSIDNDKFYFDSYYQIGVQQTIRQFDQMIAYQNNGVDYLIVLDNDQTIDNNDKYSTLKVFVLADQLTLVSEWDSKTFGTDILYPINDFSLSRNIIFVTLGNYGIGYGLLSGKQVASPAKVHLSAIGAIKDVLLASSYFKQVEMLQFNTQKSELSIFVTSTNSLSMVINFLLTDKELIYQTIAQTYFRYGTQRLLNWHSINSQKLFLSYYNDGSQTVTIVAFNRRNSDRIEFYQGITVTLSKNLVKYHQAYITNSGKLLVSHLTDKPEVGFLQVYNIGNKFTLHFAYEKAGNFKSIDFVASNSYHTTTHSQKIQFDAPPSPPPPPPPPPPGPEGLKWYVVVIIVACVLLGVGLAYGLFRYTKKKREEKNVSLLTERQQDNSEDDVKKRRSGDKLNDTIEVQEIKE